MSERSINIKDNLTYYIGWKICRFVFFTLRRCKVEGLENIPQRFPFIIAPNHASYIDPPLVGAACEFPLNYMAKKELFFVPVLGFLLPRINVFAVNRKTGDVAAIKTALKILKMSKPLLIFPTGTRRKSGTSDSPVKTGVGYFACHMQIPVVPVYLKNTDKFLSFKPIKVIFGKPILPPENYTKSDYESFSKKIMEEINNLKSKN